MKLLPALCSAVLAVAACLQAALPTTTPTTTPTSTQATTPSPEPTTGPTQPSSPSPTTGPTATAPAGQPIQLLVDTDGAPDDLVAISFLVSSPAVSITAITVTGTGEIHCPEPGLGVILKLLERLAAPEIPVACGSVEPLALGHAFPAGFRDNADNAAGLDLPSTSRQPSPLSAVELIDASATAAGGELRVLTLGPLTNVAEALANNAELAGSIESIYIMGGAVEVPGNIIPFLPDIPTDNSTAEWNIYADPVAAQAVLDAGIPVFLVSLDGTNQVPITAALVSQARDGRGSPGLGILAELFDKNDYMTGGDYYLWDTVAAVAAAGYPGVEFTQAYLSVDVNEGPTSGRTVLGEGSPNASYATGADPAAIEDLLISVMGGE